MKCFSPLAFLKPKRQEQTNIKQPYEVHPTGLPGDDKKPQYTDISLTALLNAHLGTINTQRQTIWQRFTAMILANSITLGFLREVPGQPKMDKTDAWFSLIFGIVLCLAWMVMTQSGWNNLNRRIRFAKGFKWDGYPSPIDIEQLPDIQPRYRIDWIRCMATSVIVIFMAGYVVLFLRNR